jgi:adenylyl-sulfate kinase
VISLKNLQPLVIWLTGLSGAGKSSMATYLEISLMQKNIKTFIIDGDVLRAASGHDLGFSKEDRSKNVMRATQLAKEKLQQGFLVIVAMISPFIKDREHARSQFKSSEFTEVYVSTPLSECERRDPKGLCKKTRDGLILDMTGIHSPYEPPARPDVIIDTSNHSIEMSVKLIMQRVLAN